MNFIPGWTLAGNAFVHGFVSGFLASGGNAKAGMVGMMSAGLASKVGGFADAQGLGNFGRSALHGITQGAIAAAGGGRFGDGALGAFSGSLLSFIPEAVAGPYGRKDGQIGRMVAAAAVGGTASKLGGGKFANGAWSAAFVSRFNHDSGFGREPMKNPFRAMWEGFQMRFGGIESDMASVPGLRDDMAGAGQAITQSVDAAQNASLVVGTCGGKGYVGCLEGSLGFHGIDFFFGKGLGEGFRPYGGITYDEVRHLGVTVRHVGGYGHYTGSINVSQAGTSVSHTVTFHSSPPFFGKVYGYTWNVIQWRRD
jgi:hypothetical protein